jgi:hypothetical protein
VESSNSSGDQAEKLAVCVIFVFVCCFFLYKILVCVCVCVCVCVRACTRARARMLIGVYGSPGAGVIWMSCPGYWEANVGPLPEE